MTIAAFISVGPFWSKKDRGSWSTLKGEAEHRSRRRQ